MIIGEVEQSRTVISHPASGRNLSAFPFKLRPRMINSEYCCGFSPLPASGVKRLGLGRIAVLGCERGGQFGVRGGLGIFN